jgi:hypothetical protein
MAAKIDGEGNRAIEHGQRRSFAIPIGQIQAGIDIHGPAGARTCGPRRRRSGGRFPGNRGHGIFPVSGKTLEFRGFIPISTVC